PDCRSSSAACDSSSTTFVGHRPSGEPPRGPGSAARLTPPCSAYLFVELASSAERGPSESEPSPIRVASMFSAPVPYASTFAATVPTRGFRAITIGSNAGFSAVPQPSQSPSRFLDFGNPDPYSHAIESRISNPASSIPDCSRCHVREPPNASRCPPGFNTRRHSVAHSVHHDSNSAGVNRSQPLPMNSSAYGGSVTTASTDWSARVRITSMQSPWNRRTGPAS